MPGHDAPRGRRISPPPSRAATPPADETVPLSELLKRGYFDESGNLRPEYVERRKMEPLARLMIDDHPPLTMHQVRRFFQHCRAIEAKLRAGTATWEAEAATFRRLDVAAADAFFKSPKKIPEVFHDFIQKNVAAVRTEKDFLQGFLPHFEALVGFGTQFFRERERS